MNWIYYLLAAIGGAMNTVQAGANAQLRKSIDQPVIAGLAVYVTGLITLLIIFVLGFWKGADFSKFGQAPWWAWLGGVLSVGSTMAAVLFARRLGSAGFTAVTLTASLTCSVLLDHFGWIGFEVHRASWPRVLGCALLWGGLMLVTKF